MGWIWCRNRHRSHHHVLPTPYATAAVAHHTQRKPQHSKRPPQNQVLRDERRELQIGGGQILQPRNVHLPNLQTLDPHQPQPTEQRPVCEAVAYDGRRSALVLDLYRRPDARDVQELEGVEPQMRGAALGKHLPALHPGNRVGLHRVQRNGRGVGGVEDEGGEGFG